MAEDIVSQLVEKLKMPKTFALQLHEPPDISGEAPLIATDINEHILFCKSIKANSTAEEIFKIIEFSFF